MTEYKSLRAQILEAILATLKAVTTANGWQVTLKRVEIMRRSGLTNLEYPFTIIIPDGESKDLTPNQLYNCELTLAIETMILENVGNKLALQCDKVLTDIEKALLADPQISGLAENSTIVSNDFYFSETSEPFGIVTTKLLIQYRHQFDDPSKNIIS